MLLKIHPDNPELRKVKKTVEVINKSGVIVYPTDSVYAFGCDIFDTQAIEKICRLKQLPLNHVHLTFICSDISQLARYSAHIETNVFKLIKEYTPGPITFIVKASNDTPRILKNKKKQIGIRIPDNNIAQAIIHELGRPLLSSSLKTDDPEFPYYTDVDEIVDDWMKRVDLIIDGGPGLDDPSTVVDCTGDEITLIREGLVEVDL